MHVPTLTKRETAELLSMSTDTVEALLQLRLINRHQPDYRWVQITAESVAAYTRLPVEYVLGERRRLLGRATDSGDGSCREPAPMDETPGANSHAITDSMVLTASRYQASVILGVCEASVVNLIHQGRLERTKGNRYVEVTLRSLAAYTELPLEVVIAELRQVPRRPRFAASEPASPELTVLRNGTEH